MSTVAPTLVFHTGALGDSVLIWPILRALAPLTFIAPGEKSRLAARCIPDVAPLGGDDPAWSALHAPRGWPQAGRAAAVLAGAGRVICFFSDGTDVWADNVRSAAPGATFHFIGKNPATPDPPLHLLDERLEQLRRCGLAIQPVFPAPRQNLHGPCVLHPGSGGREKCWPADRWTLLARRLREAGHEVLFVLGEVERERLEPGRRENWQQEFALKEPADLLELAALLEKARCVVANDSGPGHLAAALGVRTVSLFGPTDPRRWQPLGPQVTVLAPPSPRPMTWLEVEAVARSVG